MSVRHLVNWTASSFFHLSSKFKWMTSEKGLKASLWILSDLVRGKRLPRKERTSSHSFPCLFNSKSTSLSIPVSRPGIKGVKNPASGCYKNRAQSVYQKRHLEAKNMVFRRGFWEILENWSYEVVYKGVFYIFVVPYKLQCCESLTTTFTHVKRTSKPIPNHFQSTCLSLFLSIRLVPSSQWQELG